MAQWSSVWRQPFWADTNSRAHSLNKKREFTRFYCLWVAYQCYLSEDSGDKGRAGRDKGRTGVNWLTDRLNSVTVH